MPLPSQVKIDKFLTGVLIGTVNEEYIAPRVLPVIRPRGLTGKVAKMNRDRKITIHTIGIGPSNNLGLNGGTARR